jgi:hypothetical protein
VQDGSQRFTGLDTSGWLRVARDVRLMGGVLWLDTKTSGVDDPLVNGKRVFATPNYIVTGRIEYDTLFAPGLTLWTGAKVTGEMYVNSANTQHIPSYTTADVGALHHAHGRQDADGARRGQSMCLDAGTGRPRTTALSCQRQHARSWRMRRFSSDGHAHRKHPLAAPALPPTA